VYKEMPAISVDSLMEETRVITKWRAEVARSLTPQKYVRSKVRSCQMSFLKIEAEVNDLQSAAAENAESSWAV
jgi:hypothetical protein